MMNAENMIKVLVTGFTSNRGGVETLVINYITSIRKIFSAIQFDILGYERHPAFEDEIRACGGEIYTVPSPRHLDAHKKLNAFFQDHAGEYQVLWCNKCELANIDYLKMARKYGIPKRIIHSHNSANMYQGYKRFLFQILHDLNKRKIQNYATDFWACSDFAARWFYNEKIIQSDHYHFIPNAIDVNKFRFSESIRRIYRAKLKLKDEILIGNVGRFSYQKNHEFLIDIFHAFLNDHPDAKLILIGVGELEDKIKERVARLQIQSSVFFMGKSTEVPQWMQAMDCFLLPSHFEGLPVVGVEAQAAGLPVFASSDGISTQTKLTEQFHFLPLALSAEGWAKQIASCDLVHKDCTKEICEKGFDVDSVARNLLNKLCE